MFVEMAKLFAQRDGQKPTNVFTDSNQTLACGCANGWGASREPISRDRGATTGWPLAMPAEGVCNRSSRNHSCKIETINYHHQI